MKETQSWLLGMIVSGYVTFKNLHFPDSYLKQEGSYSWRIMGISIQKMTICRTSEGQNFKAWISFTHLMFTSFNQLSLANLFLLVMLYL